eukprot:CAMPEP_0178377900 /NCGR_PEP_ID=MMETSP0689_2-20121128/4153_1 /TAXON_ID=160604 /ORGANISM="Amphidinium massartii, Strain CS-259" /LENGTH=427 /DNA_ID=CAMNT_0019997961 /DNA_START=63 /DNA_END=1342 /DNA_ORIENTATION=-
MSSLALANTPTCSFPALLEALQDTALRSELWQSLVQAFPMTRSSSRRRSKQGPAIADDDAVLQAWLEVCPPGVFMVSRDQVLCAMPVLATYFDFRPESSSSSSTSRAQAQVNDVPCCWEGAREFWQRHGPCREVTRREERVRDVFQVTSRGQPLFRRWLKDDGSGNVHFLHFWQALGRAEGHIMGKGQDAVSRRGPLLLELEEVRDKVVSWLEDKARLSRCSMVKAHLPTVDLFKAACSMAVKSVVPDFWRIVGLCLQVSWQEYEDFNIADLTVVMLAWLDDATSVGRLVSVPRPPAPGKAVLQHTQVLLNIYDVSQEDGVQQLNMFLAHTLSPLKLGGFFHTGVEVNGLEWFYGRPLGRMATGVCCCEPRENRQHHFRQTVQMVPTTMSPEQISEIIADLIEEYSGDDYDLLRRNCCHWADDFCQR